MKKAITLHWNLSGFGKGEAVAFRVELAQGLDSVEHQIVFLTLAAGGFLPRQHRDEWIAWSYPAPSNPGSPKTGSNRIRDQTYRRRSGLHRAKGSMT
ncbi:hypothetical protein [Rhizobium sp. 2TAF27]|uniref:hypothetical protein n=1 Tax=Rhizobium sp. 2TAF27 TaxID=3233013 RepID=UPI003F9B4332